MIEGNEILKKYKETNHYGRFLEMNLEVLQPGEVKYVLKIEEKHLATPIAAHGGVVAGLIDGTLGVAALSKTMSDNNVVSTVQLNINYLKPVILGDELTAIGKVLSAGRRLLYCETAVTNQDGILVAKASGTFNAYPAEKTFNVKK